AVNAALEDVPAFASMKKYAPEVHRSISKTMLDAIDRGMPAQQASLLVRGQVQNFVSTRLPNASDTALVAYVGVMTEEMGALQAAGNGMCFQFMFPASAGGVDVSKSISKETQNKDLAALDEIVKSSNTHRAPPQQNEVMPYMQPIFIALRDKYGDGITVLEHPEAPGVDREKVCNMTRDLYTKILALPTGQAGAGLRWMFSQK
ncbi:MAG: hypothetical protein ACJ8GW_06255, partial [Massilia sp.]